MPKESKSPDTNSFFNQLVDLLDSGLHPAKRILGFTLLFIVLSAVILMALSYAAPSIPIRVADYGFWLTRPTTTAIVKALGVDLWTARILAIIFVALVIYSLLSPLRRLFPHYFFLTKRGQIILVCAWCVACITMSVRSKNVFFTRDGKPAQKYHQDSDGSIEYFPLEMNVNPSNGEPLRLVTTQLRKEEEPRHRGYEQVRVTSSPSNAEVYLNWKYIGNTPLQITESGLHGTLVIALKGYSPQYRDVSSLKGDSIAVDRQAEYPKSSKLLLLTVRQGPLNLDFPGMLRPQFLKSGLSLTAAQAERELGQYLEILGGTTNQALLAWARAKFGADFLVIVTAKESEKELGKADVGYSGIQKSLEGIYKVETTTETEVINTETGDLLISFSSQATSTSVDKMASANETLSRLSSEIANRIKKEIR